MAGVRLEWDGKSAEVPRLHLPLQVVETVNAARADRGTLFEGGADAAADGWRNQLIWGENLHVLGSLVDRYAGQIDLIYIDPPFDSRQDYKVRIAVGDDDAAADQDLAKISSVIEEKAYRDTWGKGVESYLQVLFQRLILLRELLSDRGSIFLHLAPNVSHLARALLDELFPGQFRAEIIWQRVTAHSDTKDFGTIHDSILCFNKSENHIWNPQFRSYDQTYIDSHYSNIDENGRRYQLGDLASPNPRPNMTYVWRGHEPPAYGWRYSTQTMQRLHDEGRIWYPDDKSRRPRLKRFFDEMPGMPLGVRDKINGWADYIDYWAVDFTYGSLDVDTFHNQWQSFRTRADRTLELTASHQYEEPGSYVVLVKVIDIFGNDTTARLDVTIR